MFHTVYIIWALLPLALISLTVWAVVKPWFGVRGREDSKDYFKQALFATLAFGLAIGIDQAFLNPFIESFAAEGDDTATIAHWLLYPAVLLVLAQANKMLKSMSSKNDPKRDVNFGLAKYRR